MNEQQQNIRRPRPTVPGGLKTGCRNRPYRRRIICDIKAIGLLGFIVHISKIQNYRSIN